MQYFKLVSILRQILFYFIFFSSYTSLGQRVHGTIFDDKGDLLPFSSILVKGTTMGVTANNNAQFNISLDPGIYTIVCQHVGYSKQEKTVTLTKGETVMSFILTQQKLQLREIVVKAGSEDPANNIIREAIKKREFYNKQVKSFQCEAYIKGIIKLRNLPNRILGKKVPEMDRKDMNLDSSGKGIIFLSESITKVAVEQPDKYKFEVISGRQSGGNGFGFNFPTFISLYTNNVEMSTARINSRGFISPLADGALKYYKYKFLGSFFEDGKEVNTIRVTPRRKYEPCFSGIINITEGDWRIHSCDLFLYKSSQLELIDTLQLTQINVPVTKDIWRVKSQVVHFNFKQLGIDAIGNFVNVYSKYNITPQFSKNYFDRVVIKYDTSVNKKTKQYWDSVRPVPLEPEEAKDYKIKDSLYQYRKDSAGTKQNIDSLKRRQGPIKLNNVFWTGVDRKHYSQRNSYSYHFDPIVKSLRYNSVQGIVANLSGDIQKYLKTWKTNLTISPNLSYGFNDSKLYPWLDVYFRTRDWSLDKKLKRESWNISAGKRISQFNKESNISTLGNTIGTLFYGNNYMKIYANYFSQITYNKRYEDGWQFSVNGTYEDRIPLENTSDFVISKKDRVKITPNYPVEILSSNFAPHKAFIINASISVKPGQKYIQFPFNKVSIGSKFPTFAINYSKGVNSVFGSNVDFDKWSFVVHDDVNLKLFGTIKYKLMIGGFVNTNQVFIQDYQHFNGNKSHLAKEYMNTFQLQSYYQNSNTSDFFSAFFFEHHYNGLLTNKIPLFKKLNWHFLDGANFLYINQSTPYAEIFAGFENIFKIFRVDFIAGVKYGSKPNFDIKLGAGGVLGGRLNVKRRGAN